MDRSTLSSARETVGFKRAYRIINRLTFLGGMLLILMSLWPGYAAGCFAILLLPLIAGLGLAWIIVGARNLNYRGQKSRTRVVVTAPIIVCTTLFLLVTYIPRRIAFGLFQGGFSELVASAPVGNDHYKAAGGKRIGIYNVDKYIADPRGGVFFRTGVAPDGISPDEVSYGFVFRPNSEGSPFGKRHYRIFSLFGEWYWFRA